MSLQLTAADYLRALCEAWDDFDEDARYWQLRMDALIAQAKAHLNPELEVDTDPAPAPRVCP